MKAKKVITVSKDPRKESLFRGLSALCGQAGVLVRREKLKQGPGWKVVSGSCRMGEQRLIFVDPKLPQEEQILFLRARARQLGVELPETLEQLPESRALAAEAGSEEHFQAA